MGYVSAMGRCAACTRIFSFNPLRVPSVRLKEGGAREPLCEDCMAALNKVLVENGRAPFAVPADAYTECDERELPMED